MGRNRNLNDMISQMRWVLMQNWLGQQQQQRQQENYAAQTGEYYKREKEAKADQLKLEKGKAEIDSATTFNKFMMDLGKLPEWKRIDAMTAYADMSGDEDSKMIAAQLSQKKKDMAELLAPTWIKLQQGGEIDQSDFSKVLELSDGDPQTATTMLKNWQDTAQFKQELPLKQRDTATREKQATTSSGNLGLEREKFKAEYGEGEGVGSGAKANKEYISRWKSTIQDTMNFLEPYSKGTASLGGVDKSPGATYMLKYFAKWRNKLNSGGTLPYEVEQEIENAQDIQSINERFAKKQLPGQGRKEKYGEELSGKINKELQGEVIQANQVPPGTQTATNPQTGERVALVNGKWIKII